MAKDLISSLTSDLGGDLTAGQAQLVQRASVLGSILENYETAWLSGESVDTAAWFAAIDRQHKLLVTLGLERRAKPIVDLKTYVARKERS